MENLKTETKNTTSDTDPIVELVGKIVLVAKSDGRNFAAKMLSVRGDEIWFLNKQGDRMMVKRGVVEEITPIGGD